MLQELMETSQPYTLDSMGSQTFLCYESSVKLIKNSNPRIKPSQIKSDVELRNLYSI